MGGPRPFGCFRTVRAGHPRSQEGPLDACQKRTFARAHGDGARSLVLRLASDDVTTDFRRKQSSGFEHSQLAASESGTGLVHVAALVELHGNALAA